MRKEGKTWKGEWEGKALITITRKWHCESGEPCTAGDFANKSFSEIKLSSNSYVFFCCSIVTWLLLLLLHRFVAHVLEWDGNSPVGITWEWEKDQNLGIRINYKGMGGEREFQKSICGHLFWTRKLTSRWLNDKRVFPWMVTHLTTNLARCKATSTTCEHSWH